MAILRISAKVLLSSVLPILALSSTAAAQQLQPPPVPAQNPITEAKRLLGKILFWDEQMSADNTVACATCHIPRSGGTDPRRARAAGPDGNLNTPDDIFASPGIRRSDALTDYLRDVAFGTAPQITSRAANPVINAAYSPTLFWDGRASNQFIDPQTQVVVIPAGGALESQSVGPPASGVEMGHDGIDWNEITAKLASVRPLDLATAQPPDVAAALASRPTYGQLFQNAFGDSTITAARVAMAIATYERTLIANDTPWDRFIAGNQNAMTQGQIAGWNFFQNNRCSVCHTPPLFSNNTFRNIGVRPPGEDLGRQIVTNNPGDRGRFKVPSLRNVGLKSSYMHNGQFTTLTQVIQFYTRAPGSPPMFQDNLDPLVPVPVPPQVAPALQDFMANALTDARVRDGIAPFDRPTLYTDRTADQPQILPGGSPGAGGVTPQIIAAAPAMIGSSCFKIGLDQARGGAATRLVLSSSPPVNGVLTPHRILEPKVASGAGNGNGLATEHIQITSRPGGFAPGQIVFAQWEVTDDQAPGGIARSNIARLTFFCGSAGCPQVCLGDADLSGNISSQDIFTYLAHFFANEPEADVNFNLTVTTQDLFAFLGAYFAGCQ